MKKLWLVFLLLSATLFACPTMPYGDLNCDGQVDLADFAIIAENWLREYEMSYPDKLQVSGTLTPEGTVGVYTYYGESNGGPRWLFGEFSGFPRGWLEKISTENNIYELKYLPAAGTSNTYRWRSEDAEISFPLSLTPHVAGGYGVATGTATVAEYTPLSLAAITAGWDGTTLTLTAGAVAGGLEPVSYQWQEYVDGVWGDIGADSTSVALTERDPDATYRFRLTVTDAADDAVTRYLTLNAKGLVGLIGDGALIGDGGLIAEGPLIAAG